MNLDQNPQDLTGHGIFHLELWSEISRRDELSAPYLVPHICVYAVRNASRRTGGGRHALSGNYLFEVLQRSKPHEETLAGLLRGKRGLPTWVRGMASKGNYVASASEQVMVDGVAMELFAVCQPHNCSDSQVKLLYSADGKTAYVRVIDSKLGEHIFGNPSEAQKAPLMRQGL